jgi:hypothetical protein
MVKNGGHRMFEKIMESYSTDSVGIIKEEFKQFLYKLGDRHFIIHEKTMESQEDHKKINRAWKKLKDMAKDNVDLKAAISNINDFIIYQSTLTHDLFYRYGIVAYSTNKELKTHIPEVIELYRSGKYKQHMVKPDDKCYNKTFEDYQVSRQYLINELGKPAENIIDSLVKLDAAAKEASNIILYIGAYNDAKLINQLMKASDLN